MAVFKLIAKNTLAQGLGKAAVLVLSLVTTALLTRFLGKEGYGAYTFITALTLLFGTVSDWGTNIISVREAAKEKDKPRQAKIFGSVTGFRLFLASLAFLFLNLVIRANPAWEKFVFPTTIASFVLLFLSLKTSLAIIFQTLLRLEKSALMEIVSSLVFLVLVWASFYFGQGLGFVMAAWVVATALATLAGFLLASRLTSFAWALDRRVIKRVFWEAAPTGALLLVFTVYNRIDTLILQHFWGEAAVGLYGLAYKIHDNLVLGAAFLMNAMFPLLSQKFSQKGGENLVKAYYQRAFDLLLLAGLLVSLLAFFLAPQIIHLLAGQEFLPSVGAVRILVLATLVAYFNHLTGYSLIAFGRQRMSLAIALVALTFNVVANLVFIPLYSFRAAALITVATESLVLLLSSIAIFKTIKFFPSISKSWQTWILLIKTKGSAF